MIARVPYGYRKVEVKDGGRGRWRLEIDPEPSEVVRAMYDSAVRHASSRTIATDLNDKVIPSPSGGTWDSKQVHRILLNPVNARVIVVGEGSGEPVEMPDAHPKIICWGVLTKVQGLLERLVSKANSPQG